MLNDFSCLWGFAYQDLAIILDDPDFVDMSKGDYRLKSDAEAYRKIPDFKPGDFLQMGLLK